jgi:hypothetical protein
MIDKTWNGRLPTYTPICDICGKMLEMVGSFDEALEEMELAGWDKQNIDGWENHCPDCLDNTQCSDAVKNPEKMKNANTEIKR